MMHILWMGFGAVSAGCAFAGIAWASVGAGIIAAWALVNTDPK